MHVEITLPSATVRAVYARVRCELGRSIQGTLEITSAEPLDGDALVGGPARIMAFGDDGSVAVHHGIVAEITAVATGDAEAQRTYLLEVRSPIEYLELRKNPCIFRKKNAVAIVKEVLSGISLTGDAVATEIAEDPPEREHTSQWDETDAAFLRRICEEEGLFFRFDPKDGFDALVLCDRSPSAPRGLDSALPFVDVSALQRSERVAWNARHTRRRRPGKVTVRDFDPARPALALEGSAEGGFDVEKKTEVYEAPGRFRSDPEGKRAARLRLEALRADAETLEFETAALALRPGVSFEADTHLATVPFPAVEYFVIATQLDYRAGQTEGGLWARAIPLAVPYRPPRTSRAPRVAGILPATVTGAPGDEIHTDAGGHVRVRFPWDRTGPTDDQASLPVRVMQANLPGSMLIPRVGWEVLVGFEDGDPDRPFVLGRSYNGKQLPPFGLPANKTMTALGTASSPGGGRTNMVQMDDGAGRQHMMWSAGFGKTTTAGANLSMQTVGFDNTTIQGSQTWSVGGDQTLSVQDAWGSEVGSQTGVVSGDQTITIKATGSTGVGSEAVVIGGALIEQVGSPSAGLAELAKAAVLAGVGEIPVVGAALTKGYSWGSALYQGYKSGGLSGLANAAAQTAANEVASQIPGGDAIVAAADGAGLTPWSEKAKQRAAAQDAGGGGSGAGAAGAGAAAAAPGHRKLVVDGAVTEVIGAVHAIQTPGSLKWTTLGASSFAVGGSHTTAAVRISRLTMAASADTASATKVTASSSIGRNAKAAHTLKAGGAVEIDAGGEVGVKASGPLTIQVGGALSIEGGTVVFEVPGASVSVHGGGVTLKAPQITIDGTTKHSGKESAG